MIGRFVRDRRSKWAIAFAVGSVAILLGAMAAQVQSEGHNYAHKSASGPPVVQVDLDFVTIDDASSGVAAYSLSPLGQIDLGRSPSDGLITYRSGTSFVTLKAAGSTYSGLSWWRGGIGDTPPSADGVHARYENLFPSTSADVVAGIDGVEYTLEIRSRPFVGSGDLTYDFWMDLSDGLAPAGARGPFLTSNTPRAVVSGAIPIKDGAGRNVFTVTPASAIVQFHEAPRPATDRSVSAVELTPGHEEGDRGHVPLDYAIERFGGRYKLSVIVPVQMFADPSIAWPIRIDPGITNPIANSSYFADETIIMDSDLIVTSTGAAQFSNVSIIMNRTASPNYNISVETGGRMTLLNSRVRANDSAYKYAFSVNGTLTAQDVLINHTNDGLKLNGSGSTLSNVTLTQGSGRGLVLEGANVTMSGVTIPSPAGTGLWAHLADFQASYVNITAAGSEGLYLNATSGNFTHGRVLNSTLNGAMIVNGSRMNLTLSEFSGSGRNGVLIIGGAPSLENSTVMANGWSGVALFDDHSAYVFGNRIAGNARSGIEARLNSTVDVMYNVIEGNGAAGVRGEIADPNIELNEIRGNAYGVLLNGSHNGDAKPGATSSTESGYGTLMTAIADVVPLSTPSPLTVTADIAISGSDTIPGEHDYPGVFNVVVTCWTAGPPTLLQIVKTSDENSWGSLSGSAANLAYGQSASFTLTVTPADWATLGTQYDIRLGLQIGLPPFTEVDSVMAYVDILTHSDIEVQNLTAANNSEVDLTARLLWDGSGQSGYTLAFKLDGHWIGEAETDYDGYAVLAWTVSYPPASQPLLVYFNGTSTVAPSVGDGTVHINITETRIWMTSSEARWGDTVTLTVRLVGYPDEAFLIGRWIYIGVDGETQGRVMTDGHGLASWSFEDAFDVETVDWNASFDGDEWAVWSANASTFDSQKDLSQGHTGPFTIRYGENANFVYRLTDDEGIGLASKTVTLKRAPSLEQSLETNATGWITYTDTGAAALAEGNYTFNFTFAGDSHFTSTIVQYQLAVRRWSTHWEFPVLTSFWGDNATLRAQLRDEDQNNLSDKNVAIFVNGVWLRNVTTNATGWANGWDTTVRPVGTYNVSFFFPGDGRNFGINSTTNWTVVREITVISVIIDARLFLRESLKIQLRLTEDDGVPLSRHINVTLFGGVYGEGTTDENGFLNVTFGSAGRLPMRYELWYFFEGDVEHNPAQAYTRIVVEHVSNLYGNLIEGNGYGIRANNSSSVLWNNAFSANGRAINVTNGTLMVYNSTVKQSTIHDYEVGMNASLYSTNTTFSRGKVDFAGDAILLHVRWFLGILMMDTRPLGLPGPPGFYTLTVTDSTGVVRYNQTRQAQLFFMDSHAFPCNEDTMVCPFLTITEYTQNASGKTPETAHRVTANSQGVTVIMDATKRLTLFMGNDSDVDGLPNVLEDAPDVYWYEAEGHVFDHTQFVSDSEASQHTAIARLEGDGRLTDAGSFLPIVGGSYTLMFRALAGTEGATLRVRVAAENGTELLNLTYAPYSCYRWFTTPTFAITGNQSIRVNISDASGGEAGASLRLDELALARLFLENGTRVHWETQFSNPYDSDVDKDGGVDGAEIRASNVWFEVENLVPNADERWVSSVAASNAWAAQHPDGNLTVLTLNQSLIPRAGIYSLWVRARGEGDEGVVNVQIVRDGLLRNETNLTFADGLYTYGQYLFEWPLGHNVSVVLRDGADASEGSDAPATTIDKVGLILEMARPTSSFDAIVNESLLPVDGTSLVFVEKTVVTNVFLYGAQPQDNDALVNNTAMVYWVGGEYLFGMPVEALASGNSVAATWSYHIGPNASQPITLTLPDGTKMLALTANNTIFAWALPIMPSTTPVTHFAYGPPEGRTNNMAYAEGWLVYSLPGGQAFGMKLTKHEIEFGFVVDPPSLTTASGTATIYRDKAYFGYDDGLLAVYYNSTLEGPSREAWSLVPGEWPDPRDHCPGWFGLDPTCDPPGSHALTNRGVYSTPLIDSGNLYVVAHNGSQADLVRLTEDGQVIWSINLGWPTGMAAAADTKVQLALRHDAIVVNGPILKVYSRNLGELVYAHDFEFGDVSDMGGSPVLTDRELIVPGPAGLYFFDYSDGTGMGDSSMHDANHSFGADLAEDILWQVGEVGKPMGQVLVGDFDGSGMRDAIVTGESSFAFLKDFESGHRNYMEYTQWGKDAAHNGNAEYLYPFTPTDPFDPDMDFDNLTDAYEISGFFGWKQVEAEDAFNFTAWAHNASAGGPKNFNFFHQTGVTLTADDGSVTEGAAPNTSMIQFWMNAEGVHTYRMKLVSNPTVTNIVDIRFASGNTSAATENPDTSDGYGTQAGLTNRTVEPTELFVSLNESQKERVRQMVENATYLKVKYYTLDPQQQAEPNFTYFGVKHDTKVDIFKSVWANGVGGSLWISVFISMEIDFELLGGTSLAPRGYVFEVGLNLSLVNMSALGGSALPGSVSRLRIQDLDKLEFSRRGLDAFNPDSDADTVRDGDEAFGYPLNADVDQDGLSDAYEVPLYGTNPGDKDTDHDGIRDRVELGLTGDTDPYTPWDTEESLASYPEYLAAKFRGDPFFELPKTSRTLSNNDQDPSSHTDPRDPDSDGDGIPDGWVDGWIYDPSFMIGQVRHSTATTEYLSRAQPQNYDLQYWHQSGIYDNYAQIWEGEDANLDGAVSGNEASNDSKLHWSFWPSMTSQDGDGTDATLLSYVRRGWGETNASNPDSDGDGIPEGYEIWYTTRAPIYSNLTNEVLYFSPVLNDSGLDVDTAYGNLRIDFSPESADPTYSVAIAAGTGTYVAYGARIPTPADPGTALLATSILLNLSAAAAPATVTLELWEDANSGGVAKRFLVSAPGSITSQPGWVEFDIPDTWLNFASNSYFFGLKNASANLTLWKTHIAMGWGWHRQATDGWHNFSNANGQPGIRVIDAFSADGDGLSNYEEYLIGSNPKKRDTDAGTSGPNSNFGDLLSDGQEMTNHTIYRTNATLGGLVSTYYNASSWILLDKSIETSDASDWMYFNWLESVTDPNASFAGAKNRTAFLFTLQDGTELRINVSASRLYMYLPGADFENIINDTDHANTTSHYRGQAYVFYQLNAAGAPSDYKTNAIFGAWRSTDPWLFFQKQFYASDPFDWDTDNDGLADGWEVWPWHDTDGDFVPNVRDADSDNDGLTDGQEMLQVQWNWIGENGTTAANLKFDPDGDGLYPMMDLDSDGDGIADAKEVLWSVDTDSDGRINLVDWDSDSDGLCDGWCSSSSTSAWRTSLSYFDGVFSWNVTAPPGMPNGEDVNANGTNEQGESSPVKFDTDGDGLWDGYAYNTSAAGWQLSQVVGARCNVTGNLSAHCGEESTYSLYNGSFTSKTNRTSPDTDGDGLTDTFEVHGWPIRYLDASFAAVDRYVISSPNKQDSEGDGLGDPIELILGTNSTTNDTDADGIWDGVEDHNRDGFRQSNETSAIEYDSDRDGLCDGNCSGVGEDIDVDGVRDSNEPDPLNVDTDGDRIKDGTEFSLMLHKNTGWGITHDYDGDGVTDLNDVDSDNDGLDDGVEDHDRNNLFDGNKESDPYNHDTDGDGLYDGAEPQPYEDTDTDGKININDTNSNDDNYGDADQVYVVFRTDALNGAYGDGTWVALNAPSTNPKYPEGYEPLGAQAYDFTASVALYSWAATTTAGAGAPVRNPYGPSVPEYRSIIDLKTPEGYAVYYDGSVSPHAIYIQISASHWEKYTKDSDEPGDYSDSMWFEPDFLKNHQETYDGRVATDMDPDFDDVTTLAENPCGMNPNNNDTDGDGILDGVEFRSCQDFDSDGHPDANDTDSDNDGILDGVEDANKNGRLDAGETDRLGTDTDGDGLADGTEDANHNGVWDLSGGLHTETSPIDRDSDDDGIGDKSEVDGTWCYAGELSGDCGSANHNDRKTDPRKWDTDADGLSDGQEIGLTSPGQGTLLSAFKGDANPGTVTDPMQLDTDKDGLYDGKEDLNLNGRVDPGEANPQVWDTDRDGLPDGRVDFDPGAGTTWKGEDFNNNGVRDKDATTDEWNETDLLANDSDVDGVFDGAEINGSYCFKNATSTPCANAPLLPLIADTDGDGLRDGQELSGWVVGVWYERTMEKKENRSVTSYPWLQFSDNDNMTDFAEFMNGSDPLTNDTDGDRILDPDEIALKSNITGIEGTPPTMTAPWLSVGIDWGWWGFLYLPQKAHVTIITNVSDNVGVDRVTVTLIHGGAFLRALGLATMEPRTFYGNGAKWLVVATTFDMSLGEGIATGADVNITAFDVNENGAWGEFHVDSILEAIAKAIASFLAAIAKVIAEAISAAINWIWGTISSLVKAVTDPIVNAMKAWTRDFLQTVRSVLVAAASLVTGGTFDAFGPGLDAAAMIVSGSLTSGILVVLLVLDAVQLLTLPFTALISALVSMLVDFIQPLIIQLIVGAIADAVGGIFKAVVTGDIMGVVSYFATPLMDGTFLFRSETLEMAGLVWAIVAFVIAFMIGHLMSKYEGEVFKDKQIESAGKFIGDIVKNRQVTADSRVRDRLDEKAGAKFEAQMKKMGALRTFLKDDQKRGLVMALLGIVLSAAGFVFPQVGGILSLIGLVSDAMGLVTYFSFFGGNPSDSPADLAQKTDAKEVKEGIGKKHKGFGLLSALEPGIVVGSVAFSAASFFQNTGEFVSEMQKLWGMCPKDPDPSHFEGGTYNPQSTPTTCW